MANMKGGTIYVGVTSDLIQRVWQHKHKTFPFTVIYELEKLVYYEQYPTIQEAIVREKQLKGGSRQKKIGLIETMNPYWNDLSKDWV